MKRFLHFGFILLLAVGIQSVSAQTFSEVKDINPTCTLCGSHPVFLGSFNGWTYFQADDGIHGNELWKSNGTTAGTMLVKDIAPLGNESFPGPMVQFNGKIFFPASDPDHGAEMWITDGTEAGTLLFKDIFPGPDGSDAYGFTVFDGLLIFYANDGVHGKELWKSDGTEAGTVMIAEIVPGPTGGAMSGFTAAGNNLYFSANDGAPSAGGHGVELWKTDGTAAGTKLVKDINPSTYPVKDYYSSYPRFMVDFNGILYFSAQDGINNYEVWRSDGTTAGTYLLKEINTAPSGNPGITVGSYPDNFNVLNGYLVFKAATKLWKSDGTEAGTVIIKDWSPSQGDPTRLRVMGNIVFFVADGGEGRELWKSDGTTAGTVLIKDIHPDPQTVYYAYPLNVINNRLYFVADDDIHGLELWVSDGTTSGTHMVQDIQPGSIGSNPQDIWESNGKLFIPARSEATNWELWAADDISAIPLPLHLLEFKGSLVNSDALLQWKTENELNTKSFVVERSTDGRNYTSISTIPAGRSGSLNLYNYTDEKLSSLGAAIVYYRLRQVDEDNKFTYSRIIALTLDKQQNFAMLYPNPVRNDLNLTITLGKKERLNWQLIDNNGRVLKSGIVNHAGGSVALSIDVSDISTGSYIMQLKGESLHQTIKFIKQ